MGNIYIVRNSRSAEKYHSLQINFVLQSKLFYQATPLMEGRNLIKQCPLITCYYITVHFYAQCCFIQCIKYYICGFQEI